MKFLGSKIYLTVSEMVECGVSERYLWKANSVGTKCWDFTNDPTDKRKVLVGYDALKDTYKQMVESRYGNPYEYAAKQPILDLVVNNWKANEWYRAYRFEGSKFLSMETVNKYTRGASWLDLVLKMDNYQIKKLLNIPVIAYHNHVKDLIQTEKNRGAIEGYAGIDVLPGVFPSSQQRLAALAAQYKAEGFDVLIDARFGNKNSAKLGKMAVQSGVRGAGSGKPSDLVSPSAEPRQAALKGVDAGGMTGGNVPEIVDGNGGFGADFGANTGVKCTETPANKGGFVPEIYEKQMAVIRTCAAFHNNLDAAQVKKKVDFIFAQNGWKTVSRAAIRKIISENKHLLTAGKQGKKAYMNKVAMQVKRKRPSVPMVYWTMDGWNAELLYQEFANGQTTYHNRLVAVVVLDPYCNYVIGYAIGERETPELIKEALRNAMRHVYELFGEVYQPLQLQSDNYQIKNLTPFYQSCTKLFTPAAVGNSKAKVIEPWFMELNKDCQEDYPNWSGFNINASKDNQVNIEYLDMVKKSFPDRKGCEKQLHDLLAKKRAAKINQYMAGWAKLPAADKRKMNEMDWLMVFGEQLGEGRTNRMEGVGLVKTIDRVKHYYDCNDLAWRANMHEDWLIYGDKENLNKVLAVSKDGKKRFMLTEKHEVAMALYDATEADHEERAKVNEHNRQAIAIVKETMAKDADTTRGLLAEIIYETEAQTMQKMMFTDRNGQQKEGIQDAKKLGQLGKARKKLAAVEISELQTDRDAFEKQRMAMLLETVGDMEGYGED